MARSIQDIQQQMLNQLSVTPELADLNSTSQTAIYRLFIYVVAVAIFTLENLFDFFKADVQSIIFNTKPHTLNWYASMAKNFQYGYNLPIDTDVYDNSTLTQSQIDTSKIVSYAAVVEQDRGLRIKVAKTVGADLGPLSVGELVAFKAYMKRVKDAGVKLAITTNAADNLRLSLKIKYNALVLTDTGSRTDGTAATPIQTAIREHLKNLPFNGLFSLQKLIDAIQAVEGVEDLAVYDCATKYGLLPFTAVAITTLPDAGYLRLDDIDLTINFEAA